MNHRIARHYVILRVIAILLASALPALFAQEPSSPIGVFEGHQDVGTVLHPGSAKYESANGSYTISGSGENMWFGIDDFHFVWKKVTGDVALSADISFVGNKGNNHRKAVLMIGRASTEIRPRLTSRATAMDSHLFNFVIPSVATLTRCNPMSPRQKGCDSKNGATISMLL